MYVQDMERGALPSGRGAVLLGPLLEPLHPALPLLLPLDQQRLPLQHEALPPLPLRRVVPFEGIEWRFIPRLVLQLAFERELNWCCNL